MCPRIPNLDETWIDYGNLTMALYGFLKKNMPGKRIVIDFQKYWFYYAIKTVKKIVMFDAVAKIHW